MAIDIPTRRAEPCPFPCRRGALPCLSLLLLVIFGSIASAQPVYPPLADRIVDGANLIAPEARQRIAGKLKAHEDKTGDQLVVATVPSLQGVGIEDFANGLFRFWKLGEKARNNGVLLLVAPNERKVRIEVGYGLEGALTDALSKIIVTTAIAPKFKTGDFTGGIEAGVDAIVTILTGDAEEWQRRAVVRDDESSTGDMIGVLVIFAIVLVMLFIWSRGLVRQGMRQHRTRDGRWIVLPSSGSSGWSTGSSGSSWNSGSGSDSFSGGGGSSGGGGASGDW